MAGPLVRAVPPPSPVASAGWPIRLPLPTVTTYCTPSPLAAGRHDLALGVEERAHAALIYTGPLPSSAQDRPAARPRLTPALSTGLVLDAASPRHDTAGTVQTGRWPTTRIGLLFSCSAPMRSRRVCTSVNWLLPRPAVAAGGDPASCASPAPVSFKVTRALTVLCALPHRTPRQWPILSVSECLRLYAQIPRC